MASYKMHVAKDGSVAYYLRAYDGYDRFGKQIEHRRIWRPTPSLSEKSIEKELQRQLVLFDEQVHRRQIFDSGTLFREYADRWLQNNRPPQLAPKTFERYSAMLRDIDDGIGEIRLENLQSQHLYKLYDRLRQSGLNARGNYAIARDLSAILKERHASRAAIARAADVSPATMSVATHPGRHLSIGSATKIAKALGLPIDKIFEIHYTTQGLSDRTILHYHHLVRVILAQATRDRLIPVNIADRNYMRAPRVARKESAYLQDDELHQVLAALSQEPLKWRTAVMLLAYSGLRRGELMGLEWHDIDFTHHVIQICRTCQYTQTHGIITKDTKTTTSVRTIRLPDEAFTLLKEYRESWNTLRQMLGSKWHERIEITLVNGQTQMVDNDRLFIKSDSTPMNPDSLTAWTRHFVERHNLPKFSPHALRHTNASLLIAGGINIPTVSRRLGHSSVATTTKIYAHAIQTADEIASDLLSDRLNPFKAF